MSKRNPDFDYNMALLRAYLPNFEPPMKATTLMHLHVALPSGEMVSVWPQSGKWRRHIVDTETFQGLQSLIEYAYPRLGPLREAVACLRAFTDALNAFSSKPEEAQLVSALVKGCRDVHHTEWIGPQFLPECAHIKFTGPPPPPSPSQAASFGGARTGAYRREFEELDDDIPF